MSNCDGGKVGRWDFRGAGEALDTHLQNTGASVFFGVISGWKLQGGHLYSA